MCVRVHTFPPFTPAENVYFTDHKKHPQLPPAPISKKQAWKGPWHACHPSTPQQSTQSPHCAAHSTPSQRRLSAVSHSWWLKPCSVFVLLSCNSICLKNRICTRLSCFLVFCEFSFCLQKFQCLLLVSH